MKIEIIALGFNYENGGGSHKTLDLMIRSLVEKGHNINLSTLFSDNNKIPVDLPCTVRELYFSGKFLEINKKIEELLSGTETDLFLLYGPSLVYGGGLYKKNNTSTKPVCVYVNNYLPEIYLEYVSKKNISSYIKNKIFYVKHFMWAKIVGLRHANKVDTLIYDSPVIEKIYRKFGFKTRSVIIPEFVNTSNNIIPLKIQRKFISLLYVGRITLDKGLDLLIKATAIILKEKNDVKIKIIGSGSEEQNIVDQIESNQLRDHVSIEGWTNFQELQKKYQEADIFIHPSRWIEPFGRTVLEAMSYGLPIITTENTGSAWVAQGCGLFFKKNDFKGLSGKILTLIKNKDLQNKLSQNALERARMFNYTYSAEKLDDTIRNIASQKKI